MTRDDWAMVAFFVAVFCLIIVGMAFAHDGYEGLTREVQTPYGTENLNCCSNGDCGPVAIRRNDNQLQAHIVGPPWGDHDGWENVPDNVAMDAALNPKAGPSACWLQIRGIICYWPGRDF